MMHQLTLVLHNNKYIKLNILTIVTMKFLLQSNITTKKSLKTIDKTQIHVFSQFFLHQEVGGNVYIANVNSQVFPLVNVHLITSLYSISFIEADANPLSQATSNILGLRALNEGELNKLLTPKFILLTKKESSSNIKRSRDNSGYETHKKIQRNKH
jgi:hypothetical protein